MRLAEIPQHRRRQGGVGQRRPDVRDHRHHAATTSCCSAATIRSTVAVMAIGGRGIISVASNADAGGDARRSSSCASKGDFAGARKLHYWLLPLHPGQLRRGQPDSRARRRWRRWGSSRRLSAAARPAASHEGGLRAPRSSSCGAAAASLKHASAPPPVDLTLTDLAARSRDRARLFEQGSSAPRERGARRVPSAARRARRRDACAPPSPTRRRRPAGASTSG